MRIDYTWRMGYTTIFGDGAFQYHYGKSSVRFPGLRPSLRRSGDFAVELT